MQGSKHLHNLTSNRKNYGAFKSTGRCSWITWRSRNLSFINTHSHLKKKKTAAKLPTPCIFSHLYKSCKELYKSCKERLSLGQTDINNNKIRYTNVKVWLDCATSLEPTGEGSLLVSWRSPGWKLTWQSMTTIPQAIVSERLVRVWSKTS